MKALNKETAPKAQRPNALSSLAKVISFAHLWIGLFIT